MIIASLVNGAVSAVSAGYSAALERLKDSHVVVTGLVTAATGLATTATKMFGREMVVLDCALTGGLALATLYSGALVCKKLYSREGGVARQVVLTATRGAILAGVLITQRNIVVDKVYPEASKYRLFSKECEYVGGRSDGVIVYRLVETFCNPLGGCRKEENIVSGFGYHCP